MSLAIQGTATAAGNITFAGADTGCIVTAVAREDLYGYPADPLPTCDGIAMTKITEVTQYIVGGGGGGRDSWTVARIYYLVNVGLGSKYVGLTNPAYSLRIYSLSGMCNINPSTPWATDSGYILLPATNQSISGGGPLVAASFGATNPMGIMHFT
jgi:hypothetical protein